MAGVRSTRTHERASVYRSGQPGGQAAVGEGERARGRIYGVRYESSVHERLMKTCRWSMFPESVGCHAWVSLTTHRHGVQSFRKLNCRLSRGSDIDRGGLGQRGSLPACSPCVAAAAPHPPPSLLSPAPSRSASNDGGAFKRVAIRLLRVRRDNDRDRRIRGEIKLASIVGINSYG